jgi:HlyD family secretion protein
MSDAVFVLLEGKAVRRPVRVGPTLPQGIRIEDGLFGGEDLLIRPPSQLKEGDRIRPKG